jgi:stage III sporulation protein AG
MGKQGKGFAFLNAVTDKKKLEWLGIVVVIALVVLVGYPVFIKDTGSAQTTQALFDAQREKQELEEVLAAIKGAGKVKVFITYETTTEKIPAYNSETTTANGGQNEAQSQRPATDGGGTIVLTERRPKIQGVVVVAQGAHDMSVRLMLSQAVQTSLGVSPGNVEVFEMK